YGSAKLYNILFTKALVDNYSAKGITAVALHPGVVNTGFGAGLSGFSNLLLSIARPFMISPDEGAETTIYLATQPSLFNINGFYFKKSKPARVSSIANNTSARQQLWALSEDLLNKSIS